MFARCAIFLDGENVEVFLHAPIPLTRYPQAAYVVTIRKKLNGLLPTSLKLWRLLQRQEADKIYLYRSWASTDIRV